MDMLIGSTLVPPTLFTWWKLKQAIVDGNKRAAVAAAIAFLRKNDVPFPQDDGSVYSATIEVANKRMDQAGLAGVLCRVVEQQS